jgi:hypothetical protein
MLLQIITLYDVCDTVLRKSGHQDDPQTALTTAEVMTVALVAAWFFAGNIEVARCYLRDSGDIPAMVSKSRLNRRLHAVTHEQWTAVLQTLRDASERTFLVDSCPMPVCQLVRSRRCRLYQDVAYYGYCAAKQMPFYGLKVHLITTADGQPVEVQLLAGCGSDIAALKENLALDLPQGSCLYADKGYNAYRFEDTLQRNKQIVLMPLRKANSKRTRPLDEEAMIRKTRKRIETTFSQVIDRLPRRIAAVTPAGFELKVLLAFIAYAILG